MDLTILACIQNEDSYTTIYEASNLNKNLFVLNEVDYSKDVDLTDIVEINEKINELTNCLKIKDYNYKEYDWLIDNLDLVKESFNNLNTLNSKLILKFIIYYL